MLVEFLYLVYKSVIDSRKDLYNKMYLIEEKIRKDTPDYEKRYKKKVRYFSNLGEFLKEYISFEDVFDYLVKYNPKWLEYPQISAEYEMNDGIIKKRQRK